VIINTGNDDFKYNDNFNHSSWLTFMKNRFEIAKQLLKKDGVIFVQCDDNEQAYLKILMDEIFWKQNLNSVITVKVSSESGVKVNANKPVRVKEYILIYTLDSKWTYKKQFVASEKYDNNYSYYVENPNLHPDEREISNIKSKYKSIHWKKATNEELMNFQIEHKNNIFSVRDISDKSKKLFWDNPNQFIIKESSTKKTILWKKWEVVFFANKVNQIDWVDKPTKYLSDIRMDIKWDGIAKEWWVKLKKWKKPEKLIQRIIDMSTSKGDLILDYHLWSWTTCAVAHKMWRQYIWIEQLDNQMQLATTRLKNVIEWDITWVSKSVGRSWWWDYLYCELLERNKKYIDMLEKASSDKEVSKIKVQIEQEKYYKYQINLDNFSEDEFSKLSIQEKKKVLIDILDLNHLFVNIWCIDDATFNVSDNDKKINKDFYGIT